MAFLDNSGDIILDAVLTDTGRMRLARGDGTFKIVKYAFGDDEINYESYDKDHPSGSAYYDLDILQTPVLEAFTNNTSTMKSKLLSIPRTNLLYLPMLKLNEANPLRRRNENTTQGNGKYIITVDDRTGRKENATDADPGLMPVGTNAGGIMNGFDPADEDDNGVYIRVDQGLDTDEIDPKHKLSSDLIETQYIIEIDNRLGTIVAPGQSAGMSAGTVGDPAAVSFIDDDNIASYFLSLGTDPSFVRRLVWDSKATAPHRGQLKGPRGTSLKFRINASTELQTGNFLFNRLGTTGDTNWALDSGTATFNYIDSTVRITGVTTGYRVDIPIRFVKRTA